MPNYKGHLAGGVAAYGLIFALLYRLNPSVLTATEWFLFALAGSLFPDVDIKSRGQKYFYRFVLLLFIVFVINRQIELLGCFSFIAITPMLAKHRGIFHRFWFVILIPFFVWFTIGFVKPHFAYPLFFNTLFFVAGAISHLWLDLGFMRMIGYRKWKVRRR